jgi:hypothetical protein
VGKLFPRGSLSFVNLAKQFQATGLLQNFSEIRKMKPVRKNAAHKESSREKSHIHRAKFNGRPKLPGWLGKDGTAAILGQAWLL